MYIFKHPVVRTKHLPAVDCKKLSYQYSILYKQCVEADVQTQAVDEMKMQFSSSEHFVWRWEISCIV
jgi:hypothetical protein